MKFKLFFILYIFILLCLLLFLYAINAHIIMFVSFIISAIIASISTFLNLKYVNKFVFFLYIFSLFFVIAPFMGIFINSFILYYIVYPEYKVIKEIEKTPKLLEVKINKWKEYFFSSAQYASYFIRNSKGNSYLIYLLYLVDLYNQKIIYFSSDYMFIYYPVRFQYNDYKNSILAILEDCRNTVQQNGKYVEIENDYWKLHCSYLEYYFISFGKVEKLDELRDELRKVNIPSDMLIEFEKDIDFLYIAFLQRDKNEEFVISFAEILRDYLNLEKLFLFTLQSQFYNRNMRKIRYIEDSNSDVYIDLAIRSYPLEFYNDVV